MPKELKPQENTDNTAPEEPVAEDQTAMELTAREIAIIEGKDPDALDEEPENEDSEQTPEGGSEGPEDPGEEDVPEGDDPPGDGEDEEGALEDETPEDEPEEDWRNDSVRSLAYSYGMSDDDLELFGSKEEFVRAGRLLDTRLSNLGSQASQPPPQEEPPKLTFEEWQHYNQQYSKQSEPEPIVPKKVDPASYNPEEHDEETIKLAQAVRSEQDRIEALEEQLQKQNRFLEEQAAREERRAMDEEINQFHRAVDNYRPEFFGKTVTDRGEYVRLSGEQSNRRSKLYEGVARIAQGILSTGGTVPSYDALVRRAGEIEFSEDFAKEKQDQYTRKVQKQSRRRRPVASAAGSATPRKPKAMTVDEIVNDSEIVQFWDNAQQLNGTNY